VQKRTAWASIWAVAVVVLAVALAAVYAHLGLWRYAIFRAGVDDGAFTQIGASVFTTFSSTLEYNLNHLLVHESPILATTYPFIVALHGAPVLIVLQSALTAATVIPVFLLARRRLPQAMAFAVAVVAAVYPPLSGEAVGDFHELAFAPVLEASLVCAIDGRRWSWAYVFAALLMLVKEDMLVGLIFVGAFTAIALPKDRDRRRCGFVIFSMGLAGLLGYFFVVRPAIDAHLAYWSFHYYQWWAFPPTPNGYVTLASPVRLTYLIDALAPLAFVPLLSRYALFAIPGFLEVMASHEGITFNIGSHYSAAWSGYLLCAFADGIRVLREGSKLTSVYAMLGAFIIALRYDQYDSPIQPGYFLYRSQLPSDAAADRQLQELPLSATILSSDSVFAHLGLHPKASITFACQQYLAFSPKSDDGWTGSELPMARRLVKSGKYRYERNDSILVILERASSDPC
jgi:uncharacterized membrane protein